MILNIKPLSYTLAILLTVFITACGGGGGGGEPDPVGKLSLNIIDGSSTTDPKDAVANANIVLLDEAGDPVNNFTSDTDGAVSAPNLPTGSYQLKISAQGFNSSPAPRIPPLPITISGNQTTVVIVELFPIDAITPIGTITGIVTDQSDNAVAGALVIAEVGAESYTTISAANGSYVLHNVAEGSADLTAFISSLNFPTLTAVTVTVDSVTADQNIVAETEATGSISGNLNFVAGGSAKIADVTLVDVGTREVIPGMRVFTNSSNNYTMSGLPDGNFEIIASLENDGIVIDPDESVTQGDPLVDVAAGVVTPSTKDFKVTGAVEVDTPATPVNNVVPELTATPTFRWHTASSYSSFNDYAIEVVNESGDTVWGGFGPVGPVKDVALLTLAKGENTDTAGNITIAYAGTVLEPGRYYQLRIYAMSDVAVSADYPQGYKLLSTTENLNGIFKVVE